MKDFILAIIMGLLAISILPKSLAANEAAQFKQKGPLTTYERFLPFAVAGDPAIQHFLGYMFFYGEGVELNYEQAHDWFHSAAEEGDARAQHNLGIFHARAIDRIPPKYYDAVEANLWFSLAAANPDYSGYSAVAAAAYELFLPSNSAAYDQLLPATLAELSKSQAKPQKNSPGKQVYQRSCAGCHGFDGYSAYPEAPSFALGDRLGQSDVVLVNSVLAGKGDMPVWGETLSAAEVGEVVTYIRDESRLWGASERELAVANNNADPSQVALGEEVYLEFCGGCHGFNGIAWYVNSPSFALRERLQKSDTELADSIKNGIGAMPPWENMLRQEYIDALVKFIRTLPSTYENGLVSELRRPDDYLRFQPKSELSPSWSDGDVR